MEQYHRATAEQFITAEHLEQYNSITLGTVQQHNRYNSYHSYNTYNVQQQSRYNSYNLERYHSRADTTAEHLEQLSQSKTD